jgi:PKD repeat protein
MQTRIERRRTALRLGAALALAAAIAGCGIQSQSPPPLSGPSEFGVSVRLTANPDRIPRDGQSQSVVTVQVFDSAGRPRPNTFLLVEVGPSGTGLSQSEIVTDANGTATFAVVAPPFSTVAPNNEIRVVVSPRSDNAGNVTVHSMPIFLLGAPNATSPTATFTFTPEAPEVTQVVVFDASASTDEGTLCASACTYSWNFGDGGSGSGQVTTHTFSSAGTFAVTLTVTDSTGAAGTSVQGVEVGAPAAPQADFVFSPTTPTAPANVQFNASTSTVGEGATIVSYAWDFGNGNTGTGVTANTSYNAAGTFNVVLTVTDNLGRTNSTSKTVTVQ